MANKPTKPGSREPVIENRRAHHDYTVLETLECGIKLQGTEVKSVRCGQISLTEGFVRSEEEPPSLKLHGVHIAEYPPAGPRQHDPIRTRVLLASKREIRTLASHARQGGATLIPLKVYFKNGRAKMLVGLCQGKRRHDKRQEMIRREDRRDMDRALRRRR
jgi:SsrA-binding protein